MLLTTIRISLLVWASTAAPARASCEVSFARTVETAKVLQREYFDADAGPMTAGWLASYWWQNANTLEALSNMILLAPTEDVRAQLVDEFLPVFETVFNATSNLTVGEANLGVNLTLSGYFDDTLWWGLGWLQAFKAVDDARYLERAEVIFNDTAARAWDTDSCLGGVAWGAHDRYKNAITNELFLALSTGLAQTTNNVSYVRWSSREWEWLRSSGIINDENLVDDGLDIFKGHEDVCLNNGGRPGGEQWTYNHGVLLSGLARLWQLTGDRDTLLLAVDIANAALRKFTSFEEDGGLLLQESVCEVTAEDTPMRTFYDMIDRGLGCDIDQLAFKGIFVRHASYLLDVIDSTEDADISTSSTALLRSAIKYNAETLWRSAACLPPSANVGVGDAVTLPALFGFRWAGPCSQGLNGPSATTQTAALDVLIADAREVCRRHS